MFKLLKLIVKNLSRSRLRSVISGLAVAALVTICFGIRAITSSIRASVSSEAGQTKLYVAERWVNPSRLPLRYVPAITNRPGVIDWTVWHGYAGFFDSTRRSNRSGIGLGTRIDNLQSMHNGLENVDPAALAALRKERTGALVGRHILDQMSWRVGDEFTFISTSHPGRDLRFRIVGMIPDGLWSHSFFFHADYLLEGTGERSTVSAVLLRTAGPDEARRVAAELRREFSARQPELKVESESAGAARLVGRSQAILAVIDGVVIVLLIDMVVVLSNAISISTRERRSEMAILRVFGFQPRHILFLVIGEAVLVGALSGAVGGTISWGATLAAAQGVIPPGQLATVLLTFPIGPSAITVGATLGALVGLIGSLVPAWNTRNVAIATVFSRIA